MHWSLITLIVFGCLVVVLGVTCVTLRYALPLESPKTVRDHVYRLLNRFHHMCEREHLTYAVTCGTLLGAVRHKSIVPIDDDADVVMQRGDCLKVKQVCERYGFNCADNLILQLTEPGSDIHLDVFIVRERYGRWEYEADGCRSRWPNEYFEAGELWPVRAVPFGPLTLWGPNKPEAMLNRAYPGWQNEMRVTSVHVGGPLRFLKWYRTVHPKSWNAYPPSHSCVECFPEHYKASS